MALRPSDTLELVAQECDFPVEQSAVVEAVGDVAIASPNGDPTSVEAVLESSEETRYASARELQSTVMSNLPDEHVGRKHYDDRSSTPQQDTQLSF